MFANLVCTLVKAIKADATIIHINRMLPLLESQERTLEDAVVGENA